MIFEDCRGLACPVPVIMTKKALESSGGAPVRVVVDNGAPRENVLRFAASRGCRILEEALENGWQITLLPDSSGQTLQPSGANRQQPVILIDSDRLGNGPEELGRLLMKNFIITLLELPSPPESIFFINSGVLLTTEGSELLEPLLKLAGTGTLIFSCGVCLDYFGLREKLVAGTVTNMYSIAEKMLSAGNPIKI
jgi:selenium metabolism protein YedF